ncbi:MAG: recombination mediator RecR [Candidatus Symbiobacter sp.]|nr:recombination mediator RecR [Candidatus Symbiobacter sp.]
MVTSNLPTGGIEIERLLGLLARLPGLGPRSARRVALHLLRRRDGLMLPLAEALVEAAHSVQSCRICHSLDSSDICSICRDPGRDRGLICVVAQIGDVWAMERGGAYRGLYHVLGGTLSALDGLGPEQLAIDSLLSRVRDTPPDEQPPPSLSAAFPPPSLSAAFPPPREVILALNATVEGQTTAHYLADLLQDSHANAQSATRSGAAALKITRLAQGLPMGGELDYLDDGTLAAALHSRRVVE